MNRLIFPVLVLGSLAACSSGGSDIQVAAAATTEEKAPAPAAAAKPGMSPGGVTVSYGCIPAEGLLTAGQITPEQMTALAAEGYKTFINLRVADENGTGWEEEFAAEAGVRFERIPVASDDDLSRENVDLLAKIMGNCPYISPLAT